MEAEQGAADLHRHHLQWAGFPCPRLGPMSGPPSCPLSLTLHWCHNKVSWKPWVAVPTCSAGALPRASHKAELKVNLHKASPLVGALLSTDTEGGGAPGFCRCAHPHRPSLPRRRALLGTTTADPALALRCHGRNSVSRFGEGGATWLTQVAVSHSTKHTHGGWRCMQGALVCPRNPDSVVCFPCSVMVISHPSFKVLRTALTLSLSSSQHPYEVHGL